MSNTMTLIASHTTASGGEASWTFSSIPQTYQDLVIYASVRDGASGVVGNTLLGSFNGSGSNFTNFVLSFGGSTPGASYYAFGQDIGADDSGSATANTFGTNIIYIPQYASSNYKFYVSDRSLANLGAEAYNYTTANQWANTAAISSITFTPSGSQTIQQGSTFYLYGI